MLVIEFIVALTIIFLVLTGWTLGVVHLVHTMRRRYRLEREADSREARKQLAIDFQALTKELTEGGNLSFSDYLAEPHPVAKKLSKTT